MCGRYALTTDAAVLAELFGLTPGDLPALTPRYNIAPTQQALVVRTDRDGGRVSGLLHWGLIPFWAKEPTIGARMINARSETAAEKPAYRTAIRRRRCLVPADGFFEWKKLEGGTGKQPYYIHRGDGAPLALAGLWDRWKDKASSGDEPGVIDSFTILTTRPNDALKHLHDRMPVIIAPGRFEQWLDPDVDDPAAFQSLLKPCASDVLAMYPVGRHVNSPRNDDAQCVERVSPVDEDSDGDSLFA